MSVPSDAKQSPAAVATPEPLEEIPVHAAASQGFTGGVTSGWWAAKAPSVIASLPSTTAPAASSRSTTHAS